MLVHVQKFKIPLWLLIGCMVFSLQPASAQETKVFNSLEEVLQYAKDKNFTFNNAVIQTKLAELTKKAAYANAINPRIPASMQVLDNTKQQAIFLPGDVFGQPGTFRQVTTGQKYSALINLQPQFDIVNLAGIAQIKSAKINQALVENQNKINEKEVYDQINTIYFNILSFQGQIEIVKKSLNTAETILKATQNRFNEDVGRKQDVNEATVNTINLKNNLEQLILNVKIQEEMLSLLLEKSVNPAIVETVWSYENTSSNLQTNSTLRSKNAQLQLQMMQQNLQVDRAQNWPTLSFVSSFNWQNLSNDFFYSHNSTAVDFSYIGLKLSMDLPTSVTKLSNIRNKKFQTEILKGTADHIAKETESLNRQLILNYEKALSQLQNFKEIAALKEDTYNKSFNQYQENILSLNDLLISYNNLLAAKLNVVTALANIGFTKSKIDINNKF